MSQRTDATMFRKVLGSYLTGVTVVTTADADGTYRGITANSFTSVSLDPPLVLFCIGKQSSNWHSFVNAAGYNIHILNADQQDLARRFTKGTTAERFAGVNVAATETGAPLIEGVGSWLACRTAQVIDAGDHHIIIGDVYNCDATDHRPLGFFQSQFQSFRLGEEIAQYSSDSSVKVTVAWILEVADDRRVVLQQKNAEELEIPKSRMKSAKLSHEELQQLAQWTVGATASIDFLFSLYESADETLTLIYRGLIAAPPDGQLAQGMVLTDLNTASPRIADRVERSILNRYQRERMDARFSLYSGSHKRGTLTPFEQSSSSPGTTHGKEQDFQTKAETRQSVEEGIPS